MNFGVKILCVIAKAFLRLKVSGKEHLRPGDYPSVFVSNHNFIYGPIAAVLYMPAHFRPWIHDVMLQVDSARREIGRSCAVVVKIFGKRIGNALLNFATRVTCSVLNSFNPIPVVRGASRDVMSTFDKTLVALEEGDNILIFPEKPKNAVGMSEEVGDDVLRPLYTGFAHVAKMYYDRTGKSLMFYPMYSDLKARAFRIGEPVMYNASLNSREGKRRLAEELQRRIAALSEISA